MDGNVQQLALWFIRARGCLLDRLPVNASSHDRRRGNLLREYDSLDQFLPHYSGAG